MKKFFTLMLLAMAVAFVGCKKSDSKNDEPDPSTAPVLKGIDGVWYDLDNGDCVYVSKEKNIVSYLNTNDLTDKKQFIGEYDSESDDEVSSILTRPQHADETVTVSLEKDGDNLSADIDGEERTFERFPYNDYKDFFGTWIREYQISYNADGTEKENGRTAVDAYTITTLTYSVSELGILGILLLLLFGSAYSWSMTLENGGNANMWTISEQESHYVWIYDSGLYLFNLSKNSDGIRNESTFTYYNMQKDGKKMAFVDVNNDGTYTKSTLIHPLTVAQVEKLFAGNTYVGTVSENSLYGKKYGADDAEAVFNTNHTGTLKVGSNKLEFKWAITEENPHGMIEITCDDESTPLGKIAIAAVNIEGDQVVFGMSGFDGATDATGNWSIAPLDKK